MSWLLLWSAADIVLLSRKKRAHKKKKFFLSGPHYRNKMVALFSLITTVLLFLPAILAEPVSSLNLHSRQLSGLNSTGIPHQCLEKQCKTVTETLDSTNCVSSNCMCTNTIASSLKACYQCYADENLNGFTQADVGIVIQAFVDGCEALGKPVSISGSSSVVANTVAVLFAGALGLVALV